ncbi:MAG: hypothetical protein LBJ61_05695 [Deltaproteobacteria bacterium]|nr:hypothetical protein [Deltaproteobacteria bacterium]
MARSGRCGDIGSLFGKGCLALGERSFSLTHVCQLTLSLSILSGSQKTALVMHGPMGRGSCVVAAAGSIKQFKRLREPQIEG